MSNDGVQARARGRVALVTGAASGIGHATARRLRDDGMTVVGADLAWPSGLSRADASGSDESSFRIGMDVSDPVGVAAGVREVFGMLGGIDVLVCSAGIPGPSVPIWDVEDHEWQKVLDVNLTGTYNCMRSVIPLMRAAGWGRIVAVASIAGKEGNPNATSYSASKAGVIGLTKAAAKEVATDGVLINCITPAVIETPLLEDVSDEHREYMLSKIPMRRMGGVDEVSEMVSWLCSDACSFSTGAVFDMSGGRATY